ncbi:MAG: hypothetical protein JW963_07425 [Anaerolineales bacterium]|nr:hypothetical protein [Anaerolineales bacterium]
MQKFLICFSLVILVIGCQPANVDDDILSSPVSTPQISPTDQVEAATSVPAHATLFQPTPDNPVTNATRTLWKGDQMPIFLEVTQTTMLGENTVQSPVLGVGPTIYFYHPDNKVLMLRSTITLAPTNKKEPPGKVAPPILRCFVFTA